MLNQRNAAHARCMSYALLLLSIPLVNISGIIFSVNTLRISAQRYQLWLSGKSLTLPLLFVHSFWIILVVVAFVFGGDAIDHLPEGTAKAVLGCVVVAMAFILLAQTVVFCCAICAYNNIFSEEFAYIGPPEDNRDREEERRG